MKLGLIENNKINNLSLLKEIKNHCYIDNDVRATWIGPNFPETDIKEMAPWAKWSIEHWAMYYGFISDIESPKNILDVGCGAGFATRCLSEIFPNSNIIGIDLSLNSINFANKYNSNNNIQYINADAINYNFNIKFDHIFVLEIFEHIKSENHYKFLDGCLNLLSEEGRLYFTTPNALDEKDDISGHIGLLNRSRAKDFINQYSKRIKLSQFYNNKKLLTLDVRQFIVNDAIWSFEDNCDIKSHFKLILE